MNYTTMKEEYLADPEHFDAKMAATIDAFIAEVGEQDPVMAHRLRAYMWRLNIHIERNSDKYPKDPPSKWMIRHTLLSDRFRRLSNGLDRFPTRNLVDTDEQNT